MEHYFYFVALLCGYSYFLYPLILKLAPARKARAAGASGDMQCPALTLIITVHNEEKRIHEKLENTLLIDYPKDLLEIIVASDCSSDATDSIVESFSDRGVRLVRADERKGKEYAQLCAIRKAGGEILVFSDVSTRIPAEALRILVHQFEDPRIGALSSEDRFISKDGRVEGEGAYVKYEMWLRRLESDRAGLVGLSGSFFAARREVCDEWDIYSPSDFNTALNCAKKGLVAITCPDVIGIYSDVKDPALEYRRKIRTVVRGMTAITRHPQVLNPLRMGLFAFQIWSHKIMRWGVPWFMLLFAILTLALADEGFVYQVALWLQVIFYGVAAIGWLFGNLRKNTAVRIIFFFVQTNLALAYALMSFLAGKRMTVWTPSQR
jgi:cellulose synthase/poly-beta-1,6-N-acetylglucosamine synthase-like glycosyltransferase